MDHWELLEPVDISTKLTINFESNKWQERKEAMDELLQLLSQNPRLADSPKYREVIERLTKVMANDSNINVVTSAAKCMAGFAKGLRAKFAPHVLLVLPVIFGKFKEKKQMLRDALIECVDAVFACTTLDHLSNAILEALASKQNPSQKCQLDLFIYRVFRSLAAKDVPKGFLKDLVAALSKHGSDADPEVRDSSFAALGAIMKCIGEKSLSVFLTPELVKDANKMAKIVEYKDKAQSEAAAMLSFIMMAPEQAMYLADEQKLHGSDADPEVRDSSFAALGAIMKCIGEKSLSVFLNPELVKDANKMAKIVEYKDKAQSEAAAMLSFIMMANAHSDCGRTSTSSAKENAFIIQNNDEMDHWQLLEPVDISSKLTIDFESNKWQERKEAMDELLQLLSQNPRLADSPKYREVIERLTKVMANDSNINVVTSAAKCMAGFAKGLRAKFAPHVLLVLPVIFGKFKEKKQMLRDALIECVDAVFACTNEGKGNPICDRERSNSGKKQRLRADVEMMINQQMLPTENINSALPYCNVCLGSTDANYQIYNLVISGTVLALIGMAGLAGNLLVILVYSHSRQRLLSISVYLMALAVSDFLMICTAMFLFVLEAWRHHGPMGLAYAYGVGAPFFFPLASFFQTTSVYFCVGAAIDLFVSVALRGPISESYCTVRIARKFVLITACLAVLYNIPHFFELRSIDCFETRDGLNVRSLQICPTEFRMSHVYYSIYYTYMYTVFMAVGPLVLLIVLNICIVVIVYLVDLSNLLVVINCTANFFVYLIFGNSFRRTLREICFGKAPPGVGPGGEMANGGARANLLVLMESEESNRNGTPSNGQQKNGTAPAAAKAKTAIVRIIGTEL
uniref:G_PROTEIN_RECEP_F1_2 domain-containing protein n=1 Tax=Globodera pallida TaxID=36090 RepID=A0A183BL30_GLOPA